MATHALLLNADYRPISVITWQRAITLVVDEKADVVEEYVGKAIASASEVFSWPAVVVLRHFATLSRKPKFNRANVLARDNYTCQYCGSKPRKGHVPALEQLTLDHVIPRAQADSRHRVRLRSGKLVHVTCWENIVTSCADCNWSKGARTPNEAGLTLRTQPRTPSAWDVLRMSLTRHSIPQEWEDYLPKGSEWRGYWDAELSEE